MASPCNQKPSLTGRLYSHFNQSLAKLKVNVLTGYFSWELPLCGNLVILLELRQYDIMQNH